MSLTRGARLGVYEIVGLIGAGGMGEVYRALNHPNILSVFDVVTLAVRVNREGVQLKVIGAQFTTSEVRNK